MALIDGKFFEVANVLLNVYFIIHIQTKSHKNKKPASPQPKKTILVKEKRRESILVNFKTPMEKWMIARLKYKVIQFPLLEPFRL